METPKYNVSFIEKTDFLNKSKWYFTEVTNLGCDCKELKTTMRPEKEIAKKEYDAIVQNVKDGLVGKIVIEKCVI